MDAGVVAALLGGAGAVLAALVALGGVIWSQLRIDTRNREAQQMAQVQLASDWALSDDPARADVGVAMLVAVRSSNTTEAVRDVIAAVLTQLLAPALADYDEITASGAQPRTSLIDPEA